MRQTTPSHIRKPALVGISIIFSLLLVHLIGAYIYMWGNYVWLPGGSTSIAIIWDTPDMMRPLSYGKNTSDEIIYPFLYRGLIRYNSEDNTAHEDLAQCDISKIEKITCTVRKDMFWSDKSVITEDDVVATFRGFAELWENPDMKEVLRDTRIEAKKWIITFSNPDKDIKILKLLSYPIYRSDMVEQMRTDRFITWSHITSGQYTFGEQVEDTAYSHDRITLIQNPNTSWQKAWFDKIHFKFFDSMGTLKNAEDTLWVIIPPIKNEWLDLSERFRPFYYRTHEYFSVFFHTDRLEKNLRNTFHWQIWTSLSWQVETNHLIVSNIFPWKPQILPRWNIGNFPDIMKKNGFMKRDDWITAIESRSTTITWSITYDKPKFFTNKQNSNVLFIDNATGGILLSWNMDPSVTAVIINGYKLKEFKPWNRKFNYRISVEDKTIQEGKNTYLLEGKIGNTNATTSETLTIYYSSDKEKLNGYKKLIDEEYTARNNTPALLAEREREKLKQKEAASNLNPLYYYDQEWKEFTVKVAYITWPQSTEAYALLVADSLKKLSIMTELIPLEPKALQEMITTGKKDYDILVAWISAGDTISEIGQLFNPDEAWKGINFSNIEIPKLSLLFWELRSATLKEEIERITHEIIVIMEEESFFLPLSSPTHTLYIDRNLKWIRNVSIIAWPKAIYDILEFASIKDAYIFNYEWKSITGFMSWIGSLLF